MSSSLVDLSPVEAVQRARSLAGQGQEDIWERLDRHLRYTLVNYLQNREEDEGELADGLLAAWQWAQREDREPWATRWCYLLELLEDGKDTPALAEELKAVSVEGRAAEMLRILVDESDPLRPSDLSERMGLSPQQISNLGRKLEDAQLIVRRSNGGRATWIIPTPRGFKLAGLLPKAAAPRQKSAVKLADEDCFWNLPERKKVA